MSTSTLMVAGFVVLLVSALLVVLVSWARRSALGSFGEAVEAAMARHLLPRVLILFCWGWLGWHFLSRTE